jgi:hypothetical protein
MQLGEVLASAPPNETHPAMLNESLFSVKYYWKYEPSCGKFRQD